MLMKQYPHREIPNFVPDSRIFPDHCLLLTDHYCLMPKQSTRHSYKTRRERNAVVARKTKIILLFAGILLILLFLRSWREWWAWGKAMFM